MRMRLNHRNGNTVARRRERQAGRRGSITVAAIVLLAVAMTVFAVWVKAAIREHRQLRLRSYDLQARRLAEAGIGRAAARMRMTPDYEGEIWRVEPDELGADHRADVEIRVERPTEEADQSPGSVFVRATAHYPRDAVLHARHTETTEVTIIPDSEPEGPG